MAWTSSACNCYGNKCEQYLLENQSGKKRKKSMNLPRRLSTMAEMGLMFIRLFTMTGGIPYFLCSWITHVLSKIWPYRYGNF